MAAKSCKPSPDQRTPLPVAGQEDADRLARLAWGIAHPARVRILSILLERRACVCGELVEMMPLAQSTVSQHLKVLKEAGLIQGEVDGPKVCYCVNPAGLQLLKGLIAAL